MRLGRGVFILILHPRCSPVSGGNIAHYSNFVSWLDDMVLAKFWAGKTHKAAEAAVAEKQQAVTVLSLRNTQEMCLVMRHCSFHSKDLSLSVTQPAGPPTGRNLHLRKGTSSLTPCLASRLVAVAPRQAQPRSPAQGMLPQSRTQPEALPDCAKTNNSVQRSSTQFSAAVTALRVSPPLTTPRSAALGHWASL